MSDDRNARWYLKLLGPNLKGKPFGWVDPSAMYVNARALNALLDDLMAPFKPEDIDVIVATEPLGFVLGAAIAARMRKGIVTIRKAGTVSAPSERVDFEDAKAGAVGQLEMRKPAFRPGTRVLLVDQWVESGGAMRGAIKLVECQGGIVAGIATVCIEESPANLRFRENYTCATAVLPDTELQRQCNAKRLSSFDGFNWEDILPEIGGTVAYGA
ncbi:phosphoribosyltransferase family protein [Mesorhizobium sp. B2-6-5]|uniref:phosphoribosyltransferase family protein n=1 Tax=Mesorhizobium sp. B2-6-5 TaxID=2589912 RepID=UPI001129DDE1|nr:phosphoribosyltransferase family protein [Mesorhizobium sp. B2-6-5]TPJ38557.1 adenine phosphoribosyltransferase [Mesorhizobium sp. B2-6-5]